MPLINPYPSYTPPPPPPPEEEAPPPPPPQGAMPLNASAAPLPAPTASAPPSPAPQGAMPLSAGSPPATQYATEAPEARNLPAPTPRVQQPSPLGQVPVIGGLLEGAANLLRGGEPAPYRPAEPGVQGLGRETYTQDIARAQEGVGTALDSHNPIDLAGAGKDLLLAQVQAQKGELDPLPSINKKEMMRLGYYLATTQQPPPDMNPAYVAAYQNDPSVQAFLGPDGANMVRAVQEGYTTPEGTVWAGGDDTTGGQGFEAAWEYLQGGRTVPQRALADYTAAPEQAAIDIASGGLGGLGEKALVRSAELAERGLGSGAGLKAAGTAATFGERALNAVGTLGLSEVVPGAIKGAGKALALTPLGKPTARAAAQEVADATAELGGEVLSARRVAGEQIGGAPTYVTRTKDVVDVHLPADAANPPADLSFRLPGKNRPLQIVENGVARAPTEADLVTTVQPLLARLPQADRKVVRDVWFDWASRTRDAAGNNLIDPFAPQILDGSGRVLFDTGRNATAHQRWLEDMAQTMRRFDDPNGEQPVLRELLIDLGRTFRDNAVHPATNRLLIEHRLQGVKNLLKQAPEFDTPAVKAQIAALERSIQTTGPGPIGTGVKYSVKGGKVPWDPADTARVQYLATRPSSEHFYRRGAALIGKDGKKGLTHQDLTLIDPRGGRGISGSRQANAFDNFRAIAAYRINTPVFRRGDVGEIGKRLHAMDGIALSPDGQAEVDGLKAVLDMTNVVPGAQAMSIPQITAELDRWLRAEPFAWHVTLPGSMTPPALGLFDPGSADELFRRRLPPDVRQKLESTYTIGGQTFRVDQQLLAWHDQLETARRLAQEVRAGRTLPAHEQKLLNRVVAQTGKMFPQQKITAETLADFSDRRLDQLGGRLVAAEQEIALGVRKVAGTKVDDRTALGKLYDNYMGALRSLILYPWVKTVTYPGQQVFGNLFTNVVAARGAIGHYNPFELRSITKYLRNPEEAVPPRLIAYRERIGLGRASALARVSRDESGSAYTWFHEPDAGFLRRSGRLLVSQAAKDWGDAGDVLHRFSLWESVFRPAERRLRRDVPAMAQQIFTEARQRTGLMLPLGKDEIDTAIRRLDAATDGQWSAVELREALFEAAGGKGAANARELYNAADQVQRLFQEQLKKLDAIATKEVERVAFGGTETVLGAAISKTFLFSWWNRNAAKLYLTEIARSPVQLGLWSRAVAAGNRNVREGQSEGFKYWTEFMRTPAGFAMSLNPISLVASMLPFVQTDAPSDKADLTPLGRFKETGWMQNLFLSPPIDAALRILGAFGPDAKRPDLLGSVRTEREVNDLLEFVNQHVHTFLATQQGHPLPVPNLDLNGFQDWLGVRLADVLPGEQPDPLDPGAQFDARLTWAVRDEVLARNPELAVPDAEGEVYGFKLAVQEAMANPDSAIYQAALDRVVDSAYGGAQGGPMGVLLTLSRYLLPFQQATLPSSQADRIARKNRDDLRQDFPEQYSSGAEVDAVDYAMSWLPWQSAEDRNLDLAKADYYGNADPQTRQALVDFNAIKDGTYDEPLSIGPLTFTPDELHILSQQDRNRIAYFWLEASGNGGAQQARSDAQAEALQANPALADVFGWEDWIAQYPGGIERALADTALVNPNVRRVADNPDLQALARENPEEYAKAVKYLGPLVAGIKESRFGADVDPNYRGVVGGLEGTVGTWYLENRGTGDSDFLTQKAAPVLEALPDYQETVRKLEQFEQANGFAPGSLVSEYQQNLIAGSSKPIPYAAYKGGVTGFTGGENFGYYLAWGLGEPADADTSPERWAQEDSAAFNRKRSIEIRQELDAGVYVPATPVVEGETAQPEPAAGLGPEGRPQFYQQVNVARGGHLYAQPNGPALGSPDPTVILNVLEVTTDETGQKWAVLQAGDGSTYYAPTSVLRRAA